MEEDIPFSAEELGQLQGLYSDFWDKEDNSKHALFLDALPENVEEDPTLAALKLIADDELKSGRDILLHWKKVGNDLYKDALGFEERKDAVLKKRRLRDALASYEKALAAECEEDRQRSLIYANRAVCFFKLRIFDASVDEAKRAILKDPQNPKGYYHAARGSLALGLQKRALSFIEEAERQLPAAALAAFEEMKFQLQQAIDRRRASEAQLQLECKKSTEHLTAVMKARGIDWKEKAAFDAPLDKPEITTSNLVAWPILFLVDEHSTSEGVGAVEESVPLNTVLEHVFAADFSWDVQRKYNPGQLRLSIWTGTNSDIYLPIEDLGQPLYRCLEKVKVVHKFLVMKVSSFI